MVPWHGALNFLLATGSLFAGTVSAAKDDSNPMFSFSELRGFERGFWDKFLYPANVEQVTANDSNSVFAPDVQGRVDITRTFNGSQLNKEYIFGLFSNSNRVSLVGVAIAYNITQFAANDNIASATTVVTFNATTFGVIVPVTIGTWVELNKDGKIQQYDATFRWFEFLLDSLAGSVAKSLNRTSETEALEYITDTLTKAICQSHDQYCTGDNQQYNETTPCYEYLTEVRFEKAYELGRNTLVCREVHEHMVQYRPDVHCPHIGSSGGGYCVDDRDYEQTVLEKYFSDSWIPFGYGKEQNAWV